MISEEFEVSYTRRDPKSLAIK